MSLLKRTPEFRALALAILVASIALVVTMGASPSSSKIDAIKTDLLFNEFQDPPDSAAPRVWWHWIDGNVTKEGIRRDLEWMDRVGLGGFQAFDVTMVTPQVVDERLVYMTPAWNEALRYATELARERDLEMAIASSPGWSVTGGPWVKPEQAMKKLVWSKLEIEGGQRFSGVLPQPPRIIGPFQDLPRKASMLLGPPKEHDQYYEDVAVIAYPVSQLEQASFPIVSVSSDDDIDYSILTDGLVSNGVQLEFGPEVKPTCLVYDYQHETAVASLLLATPIGNDFFHSATSRSVLEASSDGVDFKKVADVPGGGFIQHTITFDPVSARYFRICFRPPPPPFTDLLFTAVPGVARLSVGGNEPPSSFEINELQLFSTPRVHRAEEKAGFAHVNNYYAFPTPTITQENPISLEDVIDLTDYMRPDGTLDWQAPEGRWLIYRFGCTLTGSENAPAVPEGRGLEVDKLDADHVRKYLDDYLSMYEAAVGEDNVGNNGIRALLVDSYEAGAQNWTRSLPTEFKSRRGYELTPWMPTLAGMLVGSAEDSDRFLYDFRLTIGELLAENHFRTIAATAHAR